MWQGKIRLWLLVLWVGLGCSSHPGQLPGKNGELQAKVIRIIDGDTLEILYEGSCIKVRLAHIDCPEKRSGQAHANDCKEALAALCLEQQVSVIGSGYDRYQRLVAVIVNAQGQIVNQQMVKRGMAWHFKKYSSDPVYAQLEIEARKQRIGIWQDPNPTPPWLFRKVGNDSLETTLTRHE